MRKSSVLITALASVILLSGGPGLAAGNSSGASGVHSNGSVRSSLVDKESVSVEQIDISSGASGSRGGLKTNAAGGGRSSGASKGAHSKGYGYGKDGQGTVATSGDHRHGASRSIVPGQGYRAKNGKVYSLSASKSDYASPNGCAVPANSSPDFKGPDRRHHRDRHHHHRGDAAPSAQMPMPAPKGKPMQPGSGTSAGMQQQNDSMPKITLSGAVNAALFVRKDETGYDVGRFSQYSDAAINANYSGAVYDKGYFRYHNFNYGDYHEEYNVAADAVLKLKAEKTIPNFGGLTFGGEVGLALVGLNQDSSVISTGIRDASRGVDVFLSGEYGKLSLGYQDGVDSMFRIDADKLEAGSLDTQGVYWYRYVNLEGRDSSSPFYLTPGLFSETFNNGTNHVSARIDKFNLAVGKSRLASYLPFRINYVSPSLSGLRFGISYSPGYRSDSFTGPYYKPPVRLALGSMPYYSGEGRAPTFPILLRDVGPEFHMIGPAYKNIFSGAISYRFSLDHASGSFPQGSYIEAAAVGEMGKQKTEADLGTDIAGALLYEDLKAFAVGAKASLSGLMIAASYGNLFKSGLVQSQYTSTFGPESQTQPYAGPYFSARSRVPDHFSNVSSAGNSSSNTTYYTLGGGYEISNFYLGATYMRSKVHDTTTFSDFSLGAQYTFNRGGPASSLFTRGTSLVPYIVWHYFKTEQPDADLISAVPSKYGAGLVNRVTGSPYPASNNSGSLVMVGAKFVF